MGFRKGVTTWCIDSIKHMYDSFVTHIRTIEGETIEFPITIGLHQRST